MPQTPETIQVDLREFWGPYLQIEQENGRSGDYRRAAEFWESYDATLRGSYDRMRTIRTDLEVNAAWKSASSTVFHERVNAGEASILHWLHGGPDLLLDGTTDRGDVGTGGVALEFRELADVMLPGMFKEAGVQLDMLLKQFKVTGTQDAPGSTLLTEVPITVGDRGMILVRPGNEGPINGMISVVSRLREQLRDQFELVRMLLDVLPVTERWRGPTALTQSQSPGGNRAATEPSGAPTAANPGGAPPGGAPPGGAPPGGAPPGGAPPGGAPPGGTPPGAPGSTPDIGAPGSEVPAANVPGAELPGSADPPELPPTDPALAGGPTATLPALPSSQVPSSSIPSFTPSSLGPGSSTPSSFTPVSAPPFSSSFPNRGAEPNASNPRGSTVDSSRGAAPGGPVSGQPQPIPRTAASGGGSSTDRPGFFSPMMPPMMPPGGGMGANGIKPGEAEFAGGPTRQVGGRDALRAGLRSQLLGRTGEYDDEPPRQLTPPAGGEVLDEELWQVPDAAPVSPPESQPRRGRSWGPG